MVLKKRQAEESTNSIDRSKREEGEVMIFFFCVCMMRHHPSHPQETHHPSCLVHAATGDFLQLRPCGSSSQDTDGPQQTCPRDLCALFRTRAVRPYKN